MALIQVINQLSIKAWIYNKNRRKFSISALTTVGAFVIYLVVLSIMSIIRKGVLRNGR